MWKLAAIAQVIVLAAASLVMSASANAQVDPYLRQKQEQMLFTAVTVETDDGFGSGVVVFSDKNGASGKEQFETLILTNHHVIESALKAKMPVKVGWIQYDSNFRETGTLWKLADVLISSEEYDIALLRLHDHESQIQYVARAALPGAKLQILEHVWTIGSTLNQPPFPSEGVVATKDQYFPGGTRYIRTTMFIGHGGSGGGLYHFDPDRGYELIGMVTAIIATPAKIKAVEEKKPEEKKPEEKSEEVKMREEGNISFSLPPEVLQEFLQKVGAQTGIDFFK